MAKHASTAPARDLAMLRAELEAALLGGHDTGACREAIAAAEAQAAADAGARQNAAAADAAARHAELAAAGRAIAGGAQERLARALVPLKLPDPLSAGRNSKMDADNLDFLGEAIAVAKTAAETVATELSVAETRAQGIAGRVAALAGERDTLKRRRAAGDERPTDGASLALIAADLENLLELEAGSRAGVAELRMAHQRNATVLAEAQASFDHQEMRMTLAAHDRHLTDCLNVVHAALQERQKVARSLPLEMQNFRATVARLEALDRITVGELASIRAYTPFRGVQYVTHPIYKPSTELSEYMWRLAHQEGRFVWRWIQSWSPARAPPCGLLKPHASAFGIRPTRRRRLCGKGVSPAIIARSEPLGPEPRSTTPRPPANGSAAYARDAAAPRNGSYSLPGSVSAATIVRPN